LGQFEDLDKSVQNQMIKYLEKHIVQSPDPLPYGKMLQGSIIYGLIRYRVGDYRLICKIEKRQLLVLVVHLGHRRHVYKKIHL
jgi:mRNA interferase RelE/StbE